MGNRWASADSGFPPSPFTPTVSTNFDAGNNQLQLQGSTYDSAGNQTSIGVQASTFDAEGRMTTNTLDGTTTYVYDGEGQRVMKQTSAGTTTYVYDAVGNLAAEYNTVAAASACGTPTCYVTVDQLGSTRVVTDSSGNVTRRYDYLPFGEEIPADGVVRTTGMGYQSSADGFNPKFTGQVRDVESGLDYFNARYYSPEQGRFVSADPQNAGSDPTNPQTWNGYAYVGGNPMAYTDPSGQGFWGDLGLAVGAIGASVASMVDPALVPLFVKIGMFGFISGETTDYIRGGPWALLPVPGFGDSGGGSIAGTLGGCGGPLGSCGGLDLDPWSERLPIGRGGMWGGQSPAAGGGSAPWGEQLPATGMFPVAVGVGGAGGWILDAGLGTVCVGSGVCEAIAIGGAAVAVGTGAYIIYKKISKASGKEKASDAPSYAAYYPKRGPNETCTQYAARVVLAQFGAQDPRAHERGPGSDYSKIKKACERGGL